MALRHLAMSGLAAAALSGLGACAAVEGGLTADTTCRDYLQAPSAERHDAAVRVSAEIDGVSNPGNPMWGLSLDGACGSSPSKTVGEVFAGGR